MRAFHDLPSVDVLSDLITVDTQPQEPIDATIVPLELVCVTVVVAHVASVVHGTAVAPSR